jgi:hypothetical protein
LRALAFHYVAGAVFIAVIALFALRYLEPRLKIFSAVLLMMLNGRRKWRSRAGAHRGLFRARSWSGPRATSKILGTPSSHEHGAPLA